MGQWVVLVPRVDKWQVGWVPLGAQWVAPVPVRWPVAWAHLVGPWVVLVPRVAQWQVGWVPLVAQWVAPVPVRWLVAWARPVAKWAAWA